MDKQPSKTFIKKVQLISDDHPAFKKFLLRYKTKKEKDVVYDKPVKKKSAVMGYLLELSVRHWVKNSGFCLDEKIISWEQIDEGKCSKLFKELDYVLLKDKIHFIGEVKVSSTANGNVPVACKQLTASKELLSKIVNAMTLQIIRIDLNFNNPTEPFDEFNPDFLKVKFRDYEWNETKFKLLYLNAQDVFNYGVQNKIIKSPEIFQPAVYETELLHNRRQSNNELKEKRKLQVEVTAINEIENINSDIKQLERKIFLADIKINLSEKGWAHLPNANEEEFKIITDFIGNNIEQLNPIDNFCERTNGFCTDSPTTKFISLYSNKEEIEIKLLDAELIYLRLPIEQGHELQNIEFTSQSDNISFPLFNRFPTRKFSYSNKLARQTDSDNISLKQFEHVINKSEPTKVLLKPTGILIIDNHRIFHQRNLSTDNLKRKIILDIL